MLSLQAAPRGKHRLTEFSSERANGGLLRLNNTATTNTAHLSPSANETLQFAAHLQSMQGAVLDLSDRRV